MDKRQALKELEEEMARDASLPLRESNLVFGEGSIDPNVVFIGEAPGFHEDRLKRPFVGLAGQLLDEMIQEIGWQRDQVYISNIVKRRPPENRDPLLLEIEAYKPYLTRQLEILDAKVIVPLGRFAMNYFLPQARITRDQGKVFRLGNRFIVPMFHPAAALRAPDVMEKFKENFRKLPAIIAKCEQVADEPIESPVFPEPPEEPASQSSLF